VELLSTTITSSTNSGMARRTFSMPCSSLRQGMMTVIVRDLYMGPSFFKCRASGYHGFDVFYGFYETACAPFLLHGYAGMRGRPGQRAYGVPVQDGQGAGPVSGKPPHH